MIKLNILFTYFTLVLLSCVNDENSTNLNSASSNNDEIQMCIFDLINSQNNYTSKSNAAIVTNRRWKPGQTIRIKFLNGDPAFQELVKQYAAEWLNYANLKFEYVPATENADIRIAFRWKNGSGAWSYLGLDSQSFTKAGQGEPSMHFGWATLPNAETAKRNILHEFGHALGLIHEQLSPASTISWDLPKVYKYYIDLMGYTKEETDQFIINKYSATQTNYSEYDPLSIMHYDIDPALTTDGIGVRAMNDLSRTDMVSINEWYPFPITSIVESGERIDKISWSQTKSPNGRYSLEFTSGYLFIFDKTNEQIIWSVGNPFYRNASCYLESNGNIVIKGIGTGFTLTQSIVWNSNTSEFPGAKLYLQDDGNLLLSHNGITKWSSKSGKL
jgi:predicted Zn-dependent protease